MIPAIYNLPDAYRGDSYRPVTFRFYDSGNNPILLDGMSAASQWKNKRTNETVLSWSTEGGTIYITGNSLTLNYRCGTDMEIDPNTYGYDIQLYSGNCIVRTYARGDVIVYGDYTDITE